jgi:hypothetical protein
MTYAKVLSQGDANHPAVPMLVVTTESASSNVVRELLKAGWAPYASAVVPDEDAEIQIALDRLALIWRGVPLLEDDTNPVSPPGWWSAVDALGQRALCVVVEHGLLDLRSATFAQELAALVDSRRTASALVRVSQ